MSLNVLLIFGVTLLFTILSSFLFARFKLPQVIGHILVGVVLGISGIQLFNVDTTNQFITITYFALAMIGFTIGGELRWSRLKRFGKSILIITFLKAWAPVL